MSSKDDDIENQKTHLSDDLSAEPTLIEANDPLIGKKIEKYLIVEGIAKGGTAVVYRAIDEVLGREVAVKILHEHLEARKEVVERFKNEAKTVASLRHPNIVNVYDFFQVDQRSALVVEYVPGITLSDLIKTYRRIPEEFSLMIGAEILKGLEAAHTKGITHRDIKPANILLHQSLGVKISDFGLAKLVNSDDGLTKDGVFVGTPSFSSPEQIEGKPLDHRSDLFSLGLILYMLATGRHAFKQKGDSTTTVWFKIVRGKFQAVREIDSNLSKGFERILERSLQVDPAKRYATAREMLEEVRAVLKSRGFAHYEDELSQFLKKPLSANEALQSSGWKKPIVVAGSLFVVVVGLVSWLWFFSKEPEIAKEPPASSENSTPTPEPIVESSTPKEEPKEVPPNEIKRTPPQKTLTPRKPSTSQNRVQASRGLKGDSFILLNSSVNSQVVWSSNAERANLRFEWKNPSEEFLLGSQRSLGSPIVRSAFSDSGFDFDDWQTGNYFWKLNSSTIRELKIQSDEAYRSEIYSRNKRDLLVSSEFSDVDVQINPWNQQLKLAWPTGPDAVAYRIQVAEDSMFEKIIFSGNLSFKSVVIERFWDAPTEIFWRVSYLDESRNVFLVDPVRRVNLSLQGFAESFDIQSIDRVEKNKAWQIQAVGPRDQNVQCSVLEDPKNTVSLKRKASVFTGLLKFDNGRIFCRSTQGSSEIIFVTSTQS